VGVKFARKSINHRFFRLLNTSLKTISLFFLINLACAISVLTLLALAVTLLAYANSSKKTGRFFSPTQMCINSALVNFIQCL
jgi:hypothetical protein